MRRKLKNLGLPCKIHIDIYDNFIPHKGDVFISNGGMGYFVITFRKVNSQTHPYRWLFECLRIDPQTLDPSTRTVHFTWNKR